MTDKRQVKRSIKQLQRFKTWQLLLLLIVALLISASFLRLNNIGMIERRNAVLAADKVGDASITQERLYALQRYSSARMNANTGTIYLEEQYNRDVQKAVAQSSDGSDSNINVQADRICKSRHGGYSQAYVQCFAAELAKYPSGTNAEAKAVLPNVNLYRQEFVSPPWSPDFAGLSVVVCGLIALLIVLRALSLLMLQVLLRRHYQGI